MLSWGRLAFACSLSLGLAGCGDDDYTLSTEGRAGCETAGRAEAREGPMMLPGSACRTCHHFTAAGTVFPLPTSACNGGGLAGVTVEISSVSGEVAATLTTNAVGNFYTDLPLPSPYRARVIAPDGTTRAMAASQTEGSCAHCHRIPAAEGAPGRLSIGTATSVDAGATDR